MISFKKRYSQRGGARIPVPGTVPEILVRSGSRVAALARDEAMPHKHQRSWD